MEYTEADLLWEDAFQVSNPHPFPRKVIFPYFPMTGHVYTEYWISDTICLTRILYSHQAISRQRDKHTKHTYDRLLVPVNRIHSWSRIIEDICPRWHRVRMKLTVWLGSSGLTYTAMPAPLSVCIFYCMFKRLMAGRQV